MVGSNAKPLQLAREVLKAARMRTLMLVDQRERLGAARRVEEIVATDRIADDPQHHPASIRVQRVPGGEKDRVVVVDAAAGRQPFGAVVHREGDQV